VEVFDPNSATFTLPPQYGGANFHTVTVDVQLMTDAADGVVYLHDMLAHVVVPRSAIAPTGTLILDGHPFNCPHDVEAFLEAQYGYLGTDAVFDPQTKKYVRV
jgi:hypothetical protein